jgi:hypothetical protein
MNTPAPPLAANTPYHILFLLWAQLTCHRDFHRPKQRFIYAQTLVYGRAGEMICRFVVEILRRPIYVVSPLTLDGIISPAIFYCTG